MNSKKTVSVFFSIAFFGASIVALPTAWGMESALTFHGRLVNAACETRLDAPGQSPSALRPLKVNATLTLRIVNHDDACGKAALPVSTAYSELASVSTAVQNGVVTLTYQ